MKKRLIIAGAVVLAIISIMFLPESNELQDGEIAQTGSVEISDSLSYTHDILYPEKFSATPRVKIKLTKGSGYLEIIEQRPDGFIFKSSSLGYSLAEGAHVEWVASGFVIAQQ